MTELAIQAHHSTRAKVRLAVIMVIALSYYLSWWWLDGLSRGHQQLDVVDQLLCPVTFLSCWEVGPAAIGAWQVMLVVNAISFGIWMCFLLAARAFIVGKSTVARALGLVVSVLVPLAVSAVFMLGLLLSSIS